MKFWAGQYVRPLRSDFLDGSVTPRVFIGRTRPRTARILRFIIKKIPERRVLVAGSRGSPQVTVVIARGPYGTGFRGRGGEAGVQC